MNRRTVPSGNNGAEGGPHSCGYIPLGFWLSKHHPELRGAPRVVYMALGQFANAGNVRPTKRELRMATGLADSTLDEALKTLRRDGWLFVCLSDRSANTYTMLRGPWVGDPPPAAGPGGGRQPAPLKAREKGEEKRKAEATRTHAETGERAPAAASRPIETHPEHDQEGASAPPEGEGRGEGAETPPHPQLSPLADVAWPSEARCQELNRPPLAKVRPKAPHIALRRAVWVDGLEPDVLARLRKLSHWEDAVPFMRRACLTADEQRRVLDKLERMGARHAGKSCHGPIQDVLNERDREAEAGELIPPLPELGEVDREYVVKILDDLQAEYRGALGGNPLKANALKEQIATVRAHLGYRDVKPPKMSLEIVREEREFKRHTKNAVFALFLSAVAEESPHG